MARETVTRSKRFFCVSLQPDVCLTPVGSNIVPIPYPIKGEFKYAGPDGVIFDLSQPGVWQLD